MVNNKTYDFVIIGSGVAGALAAYKLSERKDGRSILVIEAGHSIISEEATFLKLSQAADNTLDRELRKEFVNTWALSPTKTVLSPYEKLKSNEFVPSPDGSPRAELERYYQFDKNDLEFFKATYQRIFGGSTWSWRGNCPRLVPNDFLLKSKYLVNNPAISSNTEDWAITYSDLEKHYIEAEHELGVSGNHDEWNTHYHGAFRSEPFPMENIVQSYSDQQIKNRLGNFVEINGVKIRVLSTPQARNSVAYNNNGKQQFRGACEGNGNCIPVCPTQAKYDATVHLKLAKRNSVEFLPHCVVSDLEVDGSGRISQVNYIDWLSDNIQKRHSIKARNVILATHGIETAKILLYSGLANSSGQVGLNLMDHLNNEAIGLMPEPIYTFRGPQGTSSIPAFCDGKFREQFAAFNITFGNDGWGRSESPQKTLADLVDKKIFGKELQDKFKNRVWRQIRFSYSAEMLPQSYNKVTLGDKLDPLGIPRPKISMKLDDYSRKAFVYAQTVLKQILQELKATEIQPEFPKFPNLDFNTAGHIMGTCRMGTDPTKSVVDAFGKSHDHPNLYIVGTSVFTTGATANPTLTLAALTLRTIDSIQ